MEKAGITIIGGGVVGLAIAAELSDKYRDVLLLERHESFGRESSSRNSEVIHASIYYPQDYIKGRLCLEGNRMIYDLCGKYDIPHMKNGKLIIAVNGREEEQLPGLLELAENNGAPDVRIIGKNEIKKIEPKVEAVAALYSPESGVVDSHALMMHFEAKAIERGADIIYWNELTGIKNADSGYILTIRDREGSEFRFFTEVLINSGGLNSGNVAAMAGIDQDKAGYRINFHKGIYFRVSKKLDKYPKMLIYPVPPESGSVGIHTCPDLSGGMRLGPHFFWEDEIDYNVNEKYHQFFYEFSKNFLPFLEFDDLQPDMAGIMASVQKPGEPMQDFIIRHEYDRGLEKMINLIGIESPGLTASPAIAKYVRGMVKEII